MTAEVAFAKSFLASLDSKPIKHQSDYAADLKTLELNGSYTLPRTSNPMKRPSAAFASSASATDASAPANPGAAPAATVTLRTLRATPPLDLTLPATPLTTSVLELKQRVAAELNLGNAQQVRLLHNKKPCSDAKTVADVAGERATAVELSVMVMGGGAGREKDESPAPAAQGASGAAVMGEKGFWDDLGGFLEQRVRDPEVARKALRLFEEAWREKGHA